MDDLSTFEFGPFSLDLRERLLRRDGDPVSLTPKAVDLLVALVEQPGRLMTKEELLQKVWRDTFVEESNLSYNVFALRKALGETADSPTYIETIPKRGYRFKAPVTSVRRALDVATADAPGKGTGAPRPILVFPEQPAPQFEGTAVLKPAPEPLVVDSASIDAQVPSQSSRAMRRWVSLAAAAALVAVSYPAWRWWRGRSDGATPQAIPLTTVRGVVRSPSFSPDGNYVVFTWRRPDRDNFNIYIQQVGAGSPHPLTTDPNNDQSPSWSPDGRTIAFLRHEPASSNTVLWQIAPLGGTPRQVAEVRPRRTAFRPDHLAWCPDSSCVLVTDSPGAAQDDAVFAVAMDTGVRRQLTFPKRARDVDPAISPDGRHLIFRRDTTPFSGRFYRVSLNARMEPEGEPAPVTPILSAGRAVWMPDSREVLFSWRGSLWRLDALGGGSPRRVPFVGEDSVMPVVARTADGRQRLVYVRSVTDTNVWRIDVPAAGAQASSAAAVAIGSPRSDDIADVSLDGTRVAFLSNRSGEPQLWVARPDGAEAFRLTSVAFSSTPGFPRWSPDNRLIAFHGDPEGRPDTFVMPASGGHPRPLLKNAAFPTFSRDGQWIYLSSADPKGAFRIYKIPVEGGTPVQVTGNPGAVSIESDNQDLYYVENVDRNGSPLWRLPADGGPAVKIVDGVILGSFDVVDRGIYYIDQKAEGAASGPSGGDTRLRFFDFATRQSTTVAAGLGAVTFGLSATRDGRTIFFSRVDASIDELMVAEDFR